MKKILYIPKIKIHNANALSSPYTIGFPAMTAWGGGVHAIVWLVITLTYRRTKVPGTMCLLLLLI